MANENPVTLADLKALGPALPPSERLQASETADVLSALAAVVTHGRSILDAAKQGGNAVYDFFHQSAVDQAKAAGADEPRRGNTPAPPTSPGAPAAGAAPAAIDYDALAQAIIRAQQAQASPAPANENVTPADQGEHSGADVPAQNAGNDQSTGEAGIL